MTNRQSHTTTAHRQCAHAARFAVNTALVVSLLLAGCAGAPVAGGLGSFAATHSATALTLSSPKPNSPGANVYGNYLASLHASAQNDAASAASYMGRVLAGDPQNQTALKAVFLFKIQDGDIAGAVPVAEKLLLAEPGNQLAAVTLSIAAFRRNDFAGAKAHIAKADPRGLGVLLIPLLSAWAESGQGNTDQALASLAPLSQQKAFATFQSYHMAMLAAIGGRDQIAEAQYAQTLASPGGGSMRVTQAYGQFLQSRGKHKQAATLYGLSLAHSPQHPVMTAALQLASAGKTTPMLISTTADGIAEALYGVGSVLSQDDRAGPLPLIYLRLALFINADFPAAQILLAGLMESMQQWDEAIAIYATIPDSSPLYASAQIQMALDEDNAGGSDAAIAGLRRLHAASPENQQILMALADLLRANEQYAEAVNAYDAAIAKIAAPQPSHWALFYARGVCFERLGKWQQSERDLHQALQLAPEHPLVLNYLGYSWIDRGENLVKARKMIESAARQRPEDGFIIDSLGWALYRSGDYTGSVTALENAITLRPQDPVINDHLGDAYWRVGRKLEARFQWRRALSFKPDPALLLSIEKKLNIGPHHPIPAPRLVETDAGKS